nr:transporter substrate-binding domain-containing protein [Azospirillum picis]
MRSAASRPAFRVAAASIAALLALWPAAGPAAGTGRSSPSPPAGLDLVTGDYAPFTAEELPGGGLVTELVRRAFAVGGLRYDVRFLPWRRGYDGVVAGRFLATFPYVRTPEREREVLYSDPVIEARQLVYLSTRSPMEFRDGDAGPESFRDRRICQPAGYALPPELDLLVARGEASRLTPTDLSGCIGLLADGRADALVIDEFSGAAAVARSGRGGGIRVAERPFAMVTLHLVVGRATPGAEEVVAAFNDGLKTLRDQGVYAGLLARYTAPEP